MVRQLLFLLSIACFFSSCKDDKANLNQIDITTLEPEPIVEVDSAKLVQPDWVKNAVIYEINTRHFSREGKLKQVTNSLHRLKKLGVNIIHLMPIQEIGEMNRQGELGDIRAIKDFKAIDKELGNLDDFKALVDSAHALNLKVILNWDYNKTSIDNKWVKSHPSLYFKDTISKNVQSYIDTTSLDILPINFKNPATQQQVLKAMNFWVSEANIDGFVSSVEDSISLNFWKQARTSFDTIKPVFLIDEANQFENDDIFYARFANDFKSILLDIVDDNKSFKLISDYFNKIKNADFKNSLPIYYTTNTQDNALLGTEFSQFAQYTDNYNVLIFAMGGLPSILNGQEVGLNKRLSKYDKDSIRWDKSDSTNLLPKVLNLYKKHKVLWNNSTKDQYEVIRADNDVFFFIRYNNNERIAFLQNYSNFTQYISETSVNGMKTEVDLLTNEPISITEKGIEIPPYSTVIIGQ